MKKYFIYKIFFAFMLLIGIVSCEEREEIGVEPTASAIVMNLSTDKLILDENFPSNPALTIKWEPAKYSVPVEVKYILEISSSKTFENSYNLTTTIESQTHATFTNKELNEAAKKIGLEPYVAKNMYLRVSSYIGKSNSLLQTSDVTNLLITPYVASPTYEYSDLFLIGNAVVGNWDNAATNNTLLPLLKTSSASKYTFTGLFKSGKDIGFKMIKVKGSWDAQFGFGSEGVLSTDGGSGNLTVPTDGYYKLTVDTAALTYSLVPVSTPIASYANVSITGTSTGGTDIQLVKSAFDPHSWTAANVNLKAGVFKFRANNAWDVNWGVNNEFFGTGTANGADIPLSSEWNYDIYFNDSTGDYTLIPVK